MAHLRIVRLVRGERLTWHLVGLVAVLVGAPVLILYILAAPNREGVSESIEAIAAVLVPAATLALWLWGQRSQPRGRRTLDSVADRLAEQLHAQWLDAANERRLTYPAPIAVRWRWSDLPVTGPPSDALGHQPGRRRFAPLPGMGEVTTDMASGGGVSDLFEIYAGLDSGRMTILGQPGAGKTATAIGLVLDALDHRARSADEDRRRVPVPVLVSSGQWHPERQGLVEWLANHLAREYPFLRGTRTATRLIDQGLVTLVLDGLDEMPKTLQPVALRALDEQATFRVVVVARSDELTAAASQGHLTAAAAIELQPVDNMDAASYLEGCQLVQPPKPWQAVIECVRHEPDSPLAQALDTPLMLSLLRDTYGTSDPVDELLDTCQFDARQAIEDHLLDQLLPATYTSRLGQRGPQYGLEDAQQWLRFIARQLHDRSTGDLAWWRIPGWMPSGPRKAVTCALFAATLGVVKTLQFGFSTGLITALAVVVVYFATGGTGPVFLIGFVACGVLGVAAGQAAPVLGSEFGLMIDAQTGSVPNLVVGYGAIMVVSLLSFGLPVWLTTHIVPDPESPIGPVESWRREQRRWMASAIVAGLGAGATIGLMAEMMFKTNVGPAVGLIDGTAVALNAGLMYSRTWETFLTFQQIHRAGLGPRRLLRFLDDARRRGVLRTAGPVYQFRHARLQNRLAYAADSTPTPETVVPASRV